MVQISFQESHSIKQRILVFETSNGGIVVITRPRVHQVFLSLSYAVNFSGANGIQDCHPAKFQLFFQVLQNSLLSYFSLSLAKIRLVSTCSIFLLSGQFCFTFHFSMNATAILSICLSAFRSERTSVDRTQPVSFVKVIGNDQFLHRFNVCGRKSKDFLD